MEMENWIRIFVAEVCSNPEITALHPEPGDPRPKPGEFGSNPESWQPYYYNISMKPRFNYSSEWQLTSRSISSKE